MQAVVKTADSVHMCLQLPSWLKFLLFIAACSLDIWGMMCGQYIYQFSSRQVLGLLIAQRWTPSPRCMGVVSRNDDVYLYNLEFPCSANIFDTFCHHCMN